MTSFSAENAKAVFNGKEVKGIGREKHPATLKTIGVKVLVTNDSPVELSVPFEDNLDQLNGEQFNSFVECLRDFLYNGETKDPEEFNKIIDSGYLYFMRNEF